MDDNYNYIRNLEKSKEHNNSKSQWLCIEETIKESFNLCNLEETRGDLYGKSFPHRIYLQQKFFGFKMHEGNSTNENIDKFTKLVLDLESLKC